MWDEFYEVACQTAVSAGQLLREKWQQPRHLINKGFRDIVTDADIASQTLITDTIRNRFPEHGFLPEEKNSTLPTEGEFIWIIDPLDGTTNYSRQLANFSISIAVAQKQEAGLRPLVGAIYDPMQDELFSAIEQQGSWSGTAQQWQKEHLQVSQTDTLIDAIFCLDWSHSKEKREQTLQILHTVAHQVKTVRGIGSAALALAWIAAGRVDAYLNLNLHPWDIAAGWLLIKEAGGQISSTTSNTWTVKQPDNLATNRHLHKELHTLLQQFVSPT